MANSVDPDQTPRSVASDLGQHSLQRPICPNTEVYYGINPFMQNGPFCDRSISNIRGVGMDFIITMKHKKNSELNANSVDPDQTLRSAASNLGLHCLPVSLL